MPSAGVVARGPAEDGQAAGAGPVEAAKRRSCGAGAHGLRVYDWARAEVRPWHREDRRHWALARRSLTRPGEIAYYIAYAPAEGTLDDLVQVAGARWAIEECFQSANRSVV